MELYPRRKTRTLHLGPVPIGGGAPVAIQSMNNTRTQDVPATLAQLEALAAAGCQIGRLAVPDREAVQAFLDRTEHSLTADIGFRDWMDPVR